jgi:hypothetical protein
LEKKMSKYKTVPTVKKPEEVTVPLQPPLPIDAIISLPRVGFIDNGFCLMAAVGVLGMTVRRHHGAFWEQGIQNLMQDTIEQSPNKYILTLDYDTWFTHMHILRLYQLMEMYPELDAIIPAQSRREGESPMLSLQGMKDDLNATHDISVGEYNNHDYIPIDNGHFGLSMIRKERLKDLPKPWFHSQPNKDGEWKEKRRDADMTFWDKCNDAGWHMGMATDVFIGHLQMVCTFPGMPEQGLNATHVKIHDLHKGDIPSWCVPKVMPTAPKRGPVEIRYATEKK